jgi:hypothetical protein
VGVEDIGTLRVEPQRRVVVADGPVDLIVAAIGAGARDQRLDAVGSRRLFVVNQRAADGDDLVGVISRRSSDARRGVDLRASDGLDACRDRAVLWRGPQQRGDGQVPDQGFKTTSHRIIHGKAILALCRRPCESRDPYAEHSHFEKAGGRSACNNDGLW